jgi:hypothetical protein
VRSEGIDAPTGVDAPVVGPGQPSVSHRKSRGPVVKLVRITLGMFDADATVGEAVIIVGPREWLNAPPRRSWPSLFLPCPFQLSASPFPSAFPFP